MVFFSLPTDSLCSKTCTVVCITNTKFGVNMNEYIFFYIQWTKKMVTDYFNGLHSIINRYYIISVLSIRFPNKFCFLLQMELTHNRVRKTEILYQIHGVVVQHLMLQVEHQAHHAYLRVHLIILQWPLWCNKLWRILRLCRIWCRHHTHRICYKLWLLILTLPVIYLAITPCLLLILSYR